MGWTEPKSRERVQKHKASIGEIEVKPLAREVNDIEVILSETKCREIVGAHSYVAVTNFDALSADKLMKKDAYQRLIQSTHVYQREVTHIVESILNGYRVHFQGSKVHALYYLPVADEENASIKAVLSMLVLADFAHNVFNVEYDEYADWNVGGGSDVGVAIGTRNGVNGQRETLFVGNPANRAAKIMVDRASNRITKELWEKLPADLKNCCTLLKDGTYRVACDQATLAKVCAAYDIKWDRDASALRIAADRKNFPLNKIEYSDANVAIDFSSLGWKNNKQVLAASIFGDINGFTKFVSDAVDDQAEVDALKFFHVVRKELTKVACDDYDGVHVQFQGDRIQTLLHLPKGDAKTIAVDAVKTAISMQSSFEQVIKPEFPDTTDLTLKIGIDVGTVLATQLGVHGDRDNICLGTSVENAAAIEDRCDGGLIGISKSVYDNLADSEFQSYFSFDQSFDCYVANGLTWEKIAGLKKAEDFREKALSVGLLGIAGLAAAGAVYAVTKASEQPNEPKVEPSRSYAR